MAGGLVILRGHVSGDLFEVRAQHPLPGDHVLFEIPHLDLEGQKQPAKREHHEGRGNGDR